MTKTQFFQIEEKMGEKWAKVFHKNTHGRSFCTRCTHIAFVLYFFGWLFLFVFGLTATGRCLFSCILDFHFFFPFPSNWALLVFWIFVRFVFGFFFFFLEGFLLCSSSFLICYFNQFK